MTYVRGNEIRHCKNCERPLNKSQEKYCSRKCRREIDAVLRPLTEAQLHIIIAIQEKEGVRWMPKSYTLQSMLNQYIPLIKKMNVRSVGTGKTKDYLIRFTTVGLRWLEKHGVNP